MKSRKATNNQATDIYMIIIAVSYFLVGILFGWFLYDNVLHFDKSIFWTALAAIGSLTLAVVAVWQNKNANRTNKDLMTLDKQANAISERMIKLDEERYYPYIACSCGRDSRSNVEKPNSNVQQVSYAVTHGERPVYEIILRHFDYSSDAPSERIQQPVFLKNISQAVITKLKFESIKWTIPDSENGDLKVYEKCFDTGLNNMYPSAILPNDSLILMISIDTNLEYIRHHLFNFLTTYRLTLSVQTLKHHTSQEVIIRFAAFNNTDIQYIFHEEVFPNA